MTILCAASVLKFGNSARVHESTCALERKRAAKITYAQTSLERNLNAM